MIFKPMEDGGKMKYKHIPVSPSTFESFRNIKRKIEKRIGSKISDDNVMKRMLDKFLDKFKEAED